MCIRDRTEYGQSHMAVTKIHAGIAVNNYARRAEICIDRRYMPNETPESVDAEIIAALEEVKKADPTFEYEFHNRYEPDTPVFVNDENSEIVKAIDASCEAVSYTHLDVYKRQGHWCSRSKTACLPVRFFWSVQPGLLPGI